MFDIIYNYISTMLLSSDLGIESVNTLNSDLTYILSATSIVLIFILIVLFIRAAGRFVIDLFMFR